MEENNNIEKEEKPKVDPKLMDHLEKGGKIGKSKEAKTNQDDE